MTEEQKRIERAIELACRYGGTDEMHHLQWVVDQMVRELAGERYAQIVADATSGEDGPDRGRLRKRNLWSLPFLQHRF
ncbi:TPA: hypothetical protein RVZ60_004980 [Salmonella enterica subsp. enterica serovar Derby]|nr:hypothetical protein [Escherichia coli]MDL7098592.1 hypothetical protein [Escherichia coli]WHG34317.1 hypothetical protein QDW97_25935 [Escherichia coli]HEA3702720.1 hypothetical protein [Salmonella enterica subsp. enterica serovar Derby]